jgi:hypothetical protein
MDFMASPPIPLVEHLAGRPFAFYPAILNVEHNQWFFRKSTWSEIVVVNSKSSMELSIPRRFVGEVSSIDEPVLIVGLLRELEYRDGTVWPYRRRVLEMPLAVGAENPHDTSRSPAIANRRGPAPVVGIRLETRRSRRTVKLVGGAMAAAVFLGGVSLVRENSIRPRPLTGRSLMALTAVDSYASVVRKLGPPGADRTVIQDGTPYRALTYSGRRFTVILDGSDSHYVGAVDSNWNPIHSVTLSSGESSATLLRGLKRF